MFLSSANSDALFYSANWSSWLSFSWVIAVTLLWIFPFGLVVGKTFGLRNSILWAFAPLASISTISLCAIVFGYLNIAFNAINIGICLSVLALLFIILGLFGTKRLKPQITKMKIAKLFPAFFPLALFILGTIRFSSVLKFPGAFAQNWDNSFHLSAIQKILDYQDGSSLHMGLTPPNSSSFYPAAWHDLVAIVSDSTWGTVTVESNAVMLVVSFLIRPIGIYALAKQITGNQIFSYIALAISTIAPQFPLAFIRYGSLFPNLLGTSFFPVILALTLVFFRNLPTAWPKDPSAKRKSISCLVSLCFTGPGIILCHPNIFFSYILIVVFGSLGGTLTIIWQSNKNSVFKKIGLSVLSGLGIGLTLAFGSFLVNQISSFRMMRESLIDNQIPTPAWDAFKQVLALTAGRENPYYPIFTIREVGLLGLLMIVGFVFALLDRRYWYLASSWAGGSLFFILCVSATGLRRSFYGGLWYNDAPRLVTIMLIPALLLITLGIVKAWELSFRIGGKCLSHFSKKKNVSPECFSKKNLLEINGLSSILVKILVVPIMIFSLWGPTTAQSFFHMNGLFDIIKPSKSFNNLVDADELKLFLDLPKYVPEKAITIGHPWKGNSFSWVIGKRYTFIPRLEVAPIDSEYLLAHNMSFAIKKNEVCKVIKKYRIEYLLDSPKLFVGTPDKANRLFAGLDFENAEKYGKVIAQQGKARLIKLTFCEQP